MPVHREKPGENKSLERAFDSNKKQPRTSVLDQKLDPGRRQQVFVNPEHNQNVGEGFGADAWVPSVSVGTLARQRCQASDSVQTSSHRL